MLVDVFYIVGTPARVTVLKCIPARRARLIAHGHAPMSNVRQFVEW